MKYLIIATSLALVAATACGDRERKNEQAWKPVWGDEFNYSGLPDSSLWNYDTGGHGWGNRELQFYTHSRPENARVEGGNLIITALREDYKGSAFTSARLVTKGKAAWKYGKIEVSAKLPARLGTWPAIWMLGATDPLQWPDDGEIDIMEHVGHNPGFVHGTVHCAKYNHIAGTQQTDTIYVADFADSFHEYFTEWDQDSVRVGMDGKVYFRFANERSGYAAWPFDNPMYLLLNIAVGGTWGGQKGVDSSAFPRSMVIDYVRVWQKDL